MRQVYLVARRSRDPRTKIGSVLVRENNILACGFNGIARNVKDFSERYSNRRLKNDFYIVHGEHNAILDCARKGAACLGATLYTNGYPCSGCARAIIQAGIVEVIIHKNWPQMETETWKESTGHSSQMFFEAGVKVREFDMVLNEKGYCDGKEILC